MVTGMSKLKLLSSATHRATIHAHLIELVELAAPHFGDIRRSSEFVKIYQLRAQAQVVA